MKRILISIGLAAAIAVTAFAAGCSEGKNLVKLSYYDETSYTEDGTLSTINENLFYRNDRKVDVADPCVVCVEDADDPDFGSYFLYGTTGNTGFFCWKSNDLVNWEGVGYAFLYRDLTTPEGSAVSMDSWAPEVVYDAEEGKWYLFFSASPADTAYTYIPYVAESDSPRGPFTLVDHIETYRAPDGTPLKDIADIEENNEYYFQRYMTFDPYLMADAMEQAGIAGLDDTSSLLRAIDFHPYVDEKTDEKYLYFNTSAGSYIMGMRMKNWLEPDYDSLTILTKPGYSTPSSAERDVAHEANTSVNEAAWMTEHNGKYYLTYSVNSYQDKTYQVCQAVGDSPLGEFRKLSEAEGGILLSADASLRDMVQLSAATCLCGRHILHQRRLCRPAHIWHQLCSLPHLPHRRSFPRLCTLSDLGRGAAAFAHPAVCRRNGQADAHRSAFRNRGQGEITCKHKRYDTKPSSSIWTACWYIPTNTTIWHGSNCATLGRYPSTGR